MPQPPVVLCIIRDFQLMKSICHHLRHNVLHDAVIGTTNFDDAALQLNNKTQSSIHLVIADQPMAVVGLKGAFAMLGGHRVEGILVMPAAKVAQLSSGTRTMMRNAGLALLDPTAPIFTVIFSSRAISCCMACPCAMRDHPKNLYLEAHS